MKLQRCDVSFSLPNLARYNSFRFRKFSLVSALVTFVKANERILPFVRTKSSKRTFEPVGVANVRGRLLCYFNSVLYSTEGMLKSEGKVNAVHLSEFTVIRYLHRALTPTFTFSVNDLLSSNISILIGPMKTSAVLVTHPLCIRARVPQIAPLTSLQPVSVEATGTNYLIRMSPTEELRAEALKDIVKNYHWKTMAVIGYKDREGVLERI